MNSAVNGTRAKTPSTRLGGHTRPESPPHFDTGPAENDKICQKIGNSMPFWEEKSGSFTIVMCPVLAESARVMAVSGSVRKASVIWCSICGDFGVVSDKNEA